MRSSKVWLAVAALAGAAYVADNAFRATQERGAAESATSGDRTGGTSPGHSAERRSQESDGLPDAGKLAAGAREWGAALARLERKREKFQTSGPKRYDDPQGAMDFFLEQRLPQGVNVMPLERLRRVKEELEARELAALAARGGAAASTGILGWNDIGPGNVGGRTRAMVVDPADPEVIYAAGVSGGIWKSTNAGASWSVADDFMVNLAVVTLAIDPTNSDVLYAGTGEGFFNGDALRGLGIFKSTDAGASWIQLSGTVTGVPEGAFFYVNDIVISANDPDRVYAATQFGVWRSIDAGGSWSVVLSNPDYLSTPPTSNGSNLGCMELAVRSDSFPDVLFAAFGSFNSDGLFRSTDGGDTWSQMGSVGDLQVSNQGRMALAIAPSDNDVVYVCMSNRAGKLVDVFRSTDGGDTWLPRVNFGSVTGPNLLSNLVYATGCFGPANYTQGWYDNVIAVDPLDPDIVWVGGVDLFRSDDGGENFGIASYWYFDPIDPEYVHADHHAIVFDPTYDGSTNQTMYVGNDGGIYRTGNARAATSLEDCPTGGGGSLPEIVWEGLNNGYGVTQFYHGDSAADGDVFAGGTQDNGTLLVDSAATPDGWIELFGGDGGYFAIDPTNSMIMFGETQWFPRIRKSIDGGATFDLAVTGIGDSDGLFITPFAMDQSDPNVLWTGGRRPWRTTNGALYWLSAGADFPLGGRISAIAIAPTDSNVVFLGFDNGVIAKTTDGLAPSPNWEEFSTDNGLSSGFVSSIAVSPVDPDVAYCTYSTFGVEHVLRTIDGGATWVSIDGISISGIPDIPVHWIAIRPCDTRQVFVGTELGVFESSDEGGTWLPASTGLSHTRVETLDLQDDYTLVAFTHGRGAFRSALACPCDPDAPWLDCNTNGVHDECDIVGHYSGDCNADGVPDECEIDVNGGAPGGPFFCTENCNPDCNVNGVPDDCEIDCNSNGIPDDCDITNCLPGDPSCADCNANDVPDECEPDCNDNNIPDDCDLSELTSPDCNNNAFPDECDVAGGGLLMDVDFEDGLPEGWSAEGGFQITNECRVDPPCDGDNWAYAGLTADCRYFNEQSGSLISAPITLGSTEAELIYCSLLDSEVDSDFATVYVNGVQVVRESGHATVWDERTVDLTPFPGETVTISFQFESDYGGERTLGWQVDRVRVVSGSADCNGNEIPDECDLVDDPGLDGNGNEVPDECEGVCCLTSGGCVDTVSGAAECTAGGGTFRVGDSCSTDPCPTPAQVPGLAPYPFNFRKNRVLAVAPNNPSVPVAVRIEEATHVCTGTSQLCSYDADCEEGRTCDLEDGKDWSTIGWVGPVCQVAVGSHVPADTFTSLVVSEMPELQTFPPVLFVADCEVQPRRTYALSATVDGVLFTERFVIGTILEPVKNAKKWADVVGARDPATGDYTEPNQRINVDDVSVVIAFLNNKSYRPHVTVLDLSHEVPGFKINADDLQMVMRAFSITEDYPPYKFEVEASGARHPNYCPFDPPTAVHDGCE